VTFNTHSWTDHANIIFLDLPVGTGFSYSSDGSRVSSSPVTGEDVYVFLQFFFERFPEYAELPFHLAAESFGGTYAPNFAAVIHRENKALEMGSIPNVRRINLESVILANGITNPLIQMPSVVEYACEGPYAVYSDPNGPECQALREKAPICADLIKVCYKLNSRAACIPAEIYCWGELFDPLQSECLNFCSCNATLIA